MGYLLHQARNTWVLNNQTKTKMKLYEAIKRVVDCDGIETITNQRIINILCDFQAYTEVPSSKYILRAIIADGYAKRLLQIGSWGNESKKLLNQFVTQTGFQQNVSVFVFKSIAYGLGWVKEVSVSQNDTTSTPQPVIKKNEIQLDKTQSQLDKMSDGTFQKYKKNAEDYLANIIEFKSDFENDLGAKVIPHIEFNQYEGFFLRFEVDGVVKIKYDYSIMFYAILYDANNKIITREELYVGIHHPKFEVCQCFIASSCYHKVNNIQRIVVYWTEN